MGILSSIINQPKLKKVYSESGNVFYKKEDGTIIDEQGRYKDNYEDTTIPVDELRDPINEEEAHKRLIRLREDPRYKFMMKMSSRRKDDK